MPATEYMVFSLYVKAVFDSFVTKICFSGHAEVRNSSRTAQSGCSFSGEVAASFILHHMCFLSLLCSDNPYLMPL